MALNIRPPTEALAIPTVCEAARASSAALRAGIASGTAMVTARAAGARAGTVVGAEQQNCSFLLEAARHQCKAYPDVLRLTIGIL